MSWLNNIFKKKPKAPEPPLEIFVKFMGTSPFSWTEGQIIKYKVLDSYEHDFIYLDKRAGSETYGKYLDKWPEKEDAAVINVVHKFY
jgi:hypothetical protein